MDKTVTVGIDSLTGFNGYINYNKNSNYASGSVKLINEQKHSLPIHYKLQCAQSQAILKTAINFIPNSNNFWFSILHTESYVKVVNILANDTVLTQIPFGTTTRPETFLTPQTLISTPSPIKRVLIVGPCTKNRIYKHFQNKYPDVEFVKYTSNGMDPVVVDEKFDVRLFLLTPTMFKTQVKQWLQQDINWDEIYDISTSMLTLKYKVCLEKTNDLCFISTFITPMQSPEFSLKQGRQLKFFLTRINLFLEDLIKPYSNAYLLDADNIASSIGKMYILAESVASSIKNRTFLQYNTKFINEFYPAWRGGECARMGSHIILKGVYDTKVEEFYEALYNEIESMYRTINQIDQVKLVVFDIDDTLVDGRLAERLQEVSQDKKLKNDNEEEDTLTSKWLWGVWECIALLRSRGILVSIISKNDEHIVRECFNKLIARRLKLKHFTNPKINWKPKEENMLQLLAELSLTPSSVVFIDDNPIERENMIKHFPQMRVIGSSPYELKRDLAWSPCTQVAKLSLEAQTREQTIKQTIELNKKVHDTNFDRASFLKELNVVVEPFELISSQDREFERCFALINKTNQFNTTGKRWQRSEFIEFISQKNSKVFYYKVTTKQANFNTVGVVFLQQNNIIQFLMSCRVIGLDVESAILEHIENIISQEYETIIGILVETEFNTPCRRLFANSSYIKQQDADKYYKTLHI